MEIKFAPANAAWTKVEIADHVNDIFNVDDAGEPLAQGALSPDDIMDLEAQQWADRHYQWLGEVIGESEDAALSMEEDWQREWFERVKARIASLPVVRTVFQITQGTYDQLWYYHLPDETDWTGPFNTKEEGVFHADARSMQRVEPTPALLRRQAE